MSLKEFVNNTPRIISTSATNRYTKSSGRTNTSEIKHSIKFPRKRNVENRKTGQGNTQNSNNNILYENPKRILLKEENELIKDSIPRKLSNSFNFVKSSEARSYFNFNTKINQNKNKNIDGIHLMKIQSFQINKLKEKINKMKLINKSIIGSMKIPYININFQDFQEEPKGQEKARKAQIASFDKYLNISCLETLRNEIITLKEKLEYFQNENRKISNELDYYKNENNRLINCIKKYSLESKKQSSDSNILQNSDSIKNTFNYSTQLHSLTNPQNCVSLLVGKNLKGSQDPDRIRNINLFFSNLTSCKTIKDLIMISIKEIKKMIPGELVGIININNNFFEEKKISSFHNLFIQKIPLGQHLFNVILEDSVNNWEPKFQSILELQNGRRQYNYIFKPIYDLNSSEILFGIQIENIEKDKKKQISFNAHDEFLLNIFTILFSLKLSEIIKSNEKKYMEDLYNRTINMINILLSERTCFGLIKALKEELIKFMEMEEIGIIFYDKIKNDFVSIIYNIENTQKKETHFPLYTGISGIVYQSKKVYYSNNLEQCKEFSQIIDNTPGIPNIKSFIFMPSFGTDKKINSIIQLFNKKNGPINELDLKNLNRLEYLLGHLIEIIKVINLSIDTTIGIQSTVEKIEKKYQIANSFDFGKGFQDIIDQLKNCSDIMKIKIGLERKNSF